MPCYQTRKMEEKFLLKEFFLFYSKENEKKKLNRQPDENELLFYIFNDIKRTAKRRKQKRLREMRKLSLRAGWRNEINKIRGSFLYQATTGSGVLSSRTDGEMKGTSGNLDYV